MAGKLGNSLQGIIYYYKANYCNTINQLKNYELKKLRKNLMRKNNK